MDFLKLCEKRYSGRNVHRDHSIGAATLQAILAATNLDVQSCWACWFAEVAIRKQGFMIFK